MPQDNGHDWRENIRYLNEATLRNAEEHERIWQSVAALRDSQLAVNQQVANLVEAIRSLIDRIPPENLR